MRAVALAEGDELLLAAARQVIAANYEHDRHHIGAAVRMSDGRVFVGVHVEAHVGRIMLCAEAVALGAALSAGARGAETAVAVALPDAGANGDARAVTPCWMCRELISDFGPEAWVIIPAADGGLTKVPVLDLLPAKYGRDRPPADSA
jgi:cytidine deaminase